MSKTNGFSLINPNAERDSQRVGSVGDTINRAALFNALANVKTIEEAFAVIQGMPAVERYTESELQKMQELEAAEIQKAYELGREEGEPQWIPCAERLPEEVQMVIVTIRGHDVIRCEDGETLEEAIDRVMQMLRVSVGFRDEDGWNGADGYPMIVQPVAWMPLPEPWKGEE